MRDLDTLVSQAVLQARLLERAVHDQGVWTMTWGDHTVPAQRFLTDAGVTFLADFPQGSDANEAALLCDGEMLSVRTAGPVLGFATIRWDINAHLVNAAI